MITNKLLFTPGPLTTSAIVKAGTLCDAGSRHTEFIEAVRDIRERVRRIGGEYECYPGKLSQEPYFRIGTNLKNQSRRD